MLASAPDGAVWIAWWEPAPDGRTALRCSAFDASSLAWGPGRTIVRSPALDPDQPAALTAGASGRLAVACSCLGAPDLGRVLFCQSADGGLTWSDPVLLTKESDRCPGPASPCSLTEPSLPPGSMAAPRVRTAPPAFTSGLRPGPMPARRTGCWRRTLGPAARPNLAAFLDGGALLAYRAEAQARETGPSLARLHGLRWQRSQPFAAGGGAPSGVSDEDPRLAVDGGRVALLWSAGAPGGAAVLASTSPDAGARFLRPKAVGLGRPAGRPDVALLHDGAVLGDLVGGRPAPAPAELPHSRSGRPCRSGRRRGPPRAVRSSPWRGDYAGDVPTAEALVVFTGGPAAPGLHTLLVTIPEAALLAAADEDCHCGPTPGQLRGFSLRGTLIAAAANGATLWEADAVPGVLDAGRHRFLAAPEVAAQLRPGDTYLARIERRGSDWWVFEARRLDEP